MARFMGEGERRGVWRGYWDEEGSWVNRRETGEVSCWMKIRERRSMGFLLKSNIKKDGIIGEPYKMQVKKV